MKDGYYKNENGTMSMFIVDSQRMGIFAVLKYLQEIFSGPEAIAYIKMLRDQAITLTTSEFIKKFH